MYVFGAGDCDKQFFSEISNNIGITTEDLGSNFDKLSLVKYLDKFEKSKTVIEFLSSSGILAALQLIPGQPVVCSQSLNTSAVTQVGLYSSSGREEKSVTFNSL
jgi:hypothetical protein